MNKLSLPPRVIRILAYKLREIRSCVFVLTGEYLKGFTGYVEALRDLDLISRCQWEDLRALGVKAWTLRLAFDGMRYTHKFDRLLFKKSEVVQDDSPAEQVSAPAASVELPVCRVSNGSFYMLCKKLHPREWCPYGVYMDYYAFGKVPSGWPPLPGRRSVVGGQGQVRLSSGQASS